MHTEAINHDPAITFFQTGFQLAGRPSIGSWLSYGLGSENQDLPAFVALVSQGTGNPADQPLYDRLWGSGFLPTRYQGVKFRSGADPVLYLSNPGGIDSTLRRRFLDDLSELNQLKLQETGDPEISTRIAQYEMAYRMQTSVPELTDLSKEPEAVFELYGPESRKPGTFAANCLLARRLAERGVRFIQLFHRGWDQHLHLPKQIAGQSRDTDQPSAALVSDLKQRGLLDDTLVVWGGEFGRTVYCQGKLTAEDYGRDHHPRCFTIWLAGGGVKPGISHGETDDYCYNITKDPVHVHDLHATILPLPGNRPHASNLQIPGPALPADGCAWRSGHQTDCLSARRCLRSQGVVSSCVPRMRSASSPRSSERKTQIMLKDKRSLHPMLCALLLHALIPASAFADMSGLGIVGGNSGKKLSDHTEHHLSHRQQLGSEIGRLPANECRTRQPRPSSTSTAAAGQAVTARQPSSIPCPILRWVGQLSTSAIGWPGFHLRRLPWKIAAARCAG